MKGLPFVLASSFLFILSSIASSCKDVIVTKEATIDNCNILLKVRDPSREGSQVVFVVNKGYTYSYHHPWTGKRMQFTVSQKFIGLATRNDIPPNIVKAGAAVNEAGIAFGDADVPSFWINPTRYAWDDFDWIRYACQSACNEEEAVELLKEVVTKFHAPSISENLFVVGPEKAYVIEADVFHFKVREVHGICALSNYPKELWKHRFLKKFLIASSFDKTEVETIRKGKLIRLGALLGIKILRIGEKEVEVKLFPFGKREIIHRNSGKVVGPFWVEIRGNKIAVKYKYKEWEDRIEEMLKRRYGKISVLDLMNISRLTSEDLGGLRGMSEGKNKAAVVFCIPCNKPDLSCMWFAPDQCASIFVPIHVCSNSIYKPYIDGSAASLAKALLEKYGYKSLVPLLQRVERIFLQEVKKVEKRGDKAMIAELDVQLQKQAYLMEKILLYNAKILEGVWEKNYTTTLRNFLALYESTDDSYVKSLLSSIISSMEKVESLKETKREILVERRQINPLGILISIILILILASYRFGKT